MKEHPNTKILLLDELDKLAEEQQMILLNLLQKGLLRVQTAKESTTLHFEDLKVIATGNDVEEIYKAVRDRFRHIHMNKYTQDEFYFIAERILSKKYHFKPEFIKVMIVQSYTRIADISMRGLVQFLKSIDSYNINILKERCYYYY